MSDQKERYANTGEERDEDFLSRWSRRKIENADEEAESLPAKADPAGTGEVEASGDEPAVLTDEDLPPLDEMGEDSDYSGFLSPGVSEGLKQAALRKLFSSAKFNVCDGLDDYAGDYTKFAPLGNVITADMRHNMERLVNKLADDDEEARTEAPPAPAGDEVSVASRGDGNAARETTEGETAVEGPEEDDDAERA